MRTCLASTRVEAGCEMLIMKKDIIAIIGIILVSMLFFWKSIVYGLLPIPADSLVGMYHPWRDAHSQTNPNGIAYKNYLITDPVRQQMPWRKVIIDAWKQGKVPVWDATTFSGNNIGGNIQSAAYYPLNILFLLMPFEAAWTLLIILTPIIGGIGLYWYMRKIGVGSIGAAFAAISFGYCGFSVSWMTWGVIGQTVMWLPWLLVAIEHVALGKRKWIGVLGLSIGVLLICTAGHAQMALYSLTTISIYGIVRLKNKVSQPAPSSLLLVIGIGGGVLVLTPYFLTIWNVVEASRRIGGNAWMEPGFFIPLQHIFQLLIPDVFGNPATLNYTGVWNYGEFISFIGSIGLLFAIGALGEKKEKTTWFWIGAIGICLLFALPTPIAKLPYMLHIPILSSLQPSRLIGIIDIALCILSGIGIDAWMKKWNKKSSIVASGSIILMYLGAYIYAKQMNSEAFAIAKRNMLLPAASVSIGMLILMLRGVIKSKKIVVCLGCIMLGITTFELMRFGWKYTPFVERSLVFEKTKTIEFLMSQPKPFRVMALDDRILPPNVNTWYGVETLGGYDPLYDASYEVFMAVFERGKADTSRPFGFNRIISTKNWKSPLVPITNVRFLLSLEQIDSPDWILVNREGQTYTYEYKKWKPRLYIVENSVMKKELELSLSALFDTSIDLSKTAVTEKTVSLAYAPVSDDDSVIINSYENGNIHAVVDTKQDRLVVISSRYDARLKIFIDGAPAEVLKVNAVYAGFVSPVGKHTIVITYD